MKMPVIYQYIFQVRIVCMSDTHSMTPHIKFDVPHGDIFIHAGDFTRCGRQEEVTEFNEWIGKTAFLFRLLSLRLFMSGFDLDDWGFICGRGDHDVFLHYHARIAMLPIQILGTLDLDMEEFYLCL